jgi:hypothetical protein
VFSGHLVSSRPRRGRGELLIKTLFRASGSSFSPWKSTAAETEVCWSRWCCLAAVLAAYSDMIVYVNGCAVRYIVNI